MKVISCVDNANVLLCNYSRDTSHDIIKVLRKLSKFDLMYGLILLLSTPLFTSRLVY